MKGSYNDYLARVMARFYGESYKVGIKDSPEIQFEV